MMPTSERKVFSIATVSKSYSPLLFCKYIKKIIQNNVFLKINTKIPLLTKKIVTLRNFHIRLCGLLWGLKMENFKVTDAINLLLATVTFKKIQRCQNHRQRPQRGAEKRCKFSDAL